MTTNRKPREWEIYAHLEKYALDFKKEENVFKKFDMNKGALDYIVEIMDVENDFWKYLRYYKHKRDGK